MATLGAASPPPSARRPRRMSVALMPWMAAAATMWISWRHRDPGWILGGGLLLIASSTAATWALLRTRRQALTLAERMTRAARASEAHVRALLSAVADGVLALDAEGRVRSLSLAAEGILGCEAESVLGRPVAELLPALATLEPGRLETVVRSPRAGEVPVEVAVTDMHDGLRRGFVVAVHDISARQRRERERSAQHAVTRILAESIGPDDALPRVLEVLGTSLGFEFAAAWLVDRRAGLLRPATWWVALPGTCGRLVAETRALVLPPGRGLPGRVWEQARTCWVSDLEAGEGLVRGGAALASGLRRAEASPIALGSEVLGVLELFGHLRVAPNGHQAELLEGIGSQLAQFLERAAADRSRRASDERARSVVDSMLEGLLVSDAAGRIEEVNPAAEGTFGYGSWELLGQPVSMLFEHDLARDPARFAREAWLPTLGGVREWRARGKGGAAFPVSVALVEFHTADGRRLLAAHVRDLREERQAERTKKEFVATVSHELRTPLTSIRGALALLASGALGDLPDEAHDVVQIAERNTLRLATLINDILDLERLEAGQMELRVEPVLVREAVERAVESVATLASAAGVLIEAEASACRVLAAPERLEQVLVNLLGNAVKFSPPGSTVRVSCRAMGSQAEVHVTDSGRGIPAEALPRLFERFWQVEACDAREKGGSGLGLAICRAIVARHGGQIGVESAVGRGSDFWFRLPQAPALGRGDGLLQALAEGADAGPDVLLVEPDPELSSVVVRQLLQAGLPVRPVPDAGAGQAACERQVPAVVVLDPGLQGASALVHWLLEHEPGVRLVLYTSQDGIAAAALGLDPGTPVLTRSRERGDDLATVVRRLHGEALARPERRDPCSRS